MPRNRISAVLYFTRLIGFYCVISVFADCLCTFFSLNSHLAAHASPAVTNRPKPVDPVVFHTLSKYEQGYIKEFIHQDRASYTVTKNSFHKFIMAHPTLNGFIQYYLPSHGATPVLVLRNWNFGNIVLSDANFIGAHLVNVTFDHADLNKANFTGADIWNVHFDSTHLEDANFSSAEIRHDVDFANATAHNANFSGSDLISITCKNADMSNANFLGSAVEKDNFTDANLGHANFMNADIKQTSFVHTELDSANFSGANIKNVNFSRANLNNANFTGVVRGAQ